jgi:drug/metabolite transporter (DMT)-like permease
MPLTQNQTAYIQIHIAVILFGFTAILGDLIQLPAVVLVWWRVLITSVSLLFFIQFGKSLIQIPKKQIRTYIIIGILIGLHWICFYGAIKLSNASIALVCMSTTSLFTSLIEPIFFRTKVNKLELILAASVIPSMLLIVNNINTTYINGVWVGLAAALLAAIFSSLNKVNIKGADPYSISFIELSSAWMMISLLLGIMWIFGYQADTFLPPNTSDWVYLIILALLCTTLAQVLTLKSLHHLSAFAVNLVINLEPVYGILMAIFILNDHKELSPLFYLGGGIILLSVMLYPYLHKKFNTTTI